MRRRPSLLFTIALSCLQACDLGGAHLGILSYSQDFEGDFLPDSDGLYDGWALHALPEAIAVEAGAGGHGDRALRCQLDHASDYSSLLAGTPKAEIAMESELLRGSSYLMEFDLFLPADFPIDYGDGINRLSLAQFHQASNTGSPPCMLGIDGGRYFLFNDPGSSMNHESQRIELFGDVAADRGRWVRWSIKASVSDSADGELHVYRDGILAASIEGTRTAYPVEDDYPILGLYKWGWKTFPTKTTGAIAAWYDNVSIEKGD